MVFDNDELPEVFRKNAGNMFAEQERLTAEAAAIVADLARQYPEWASADVRAMFDLLAQAAGVQGVERYRLIREDFFRHAHDVKGQGATFGYSLMTDLGAAICDFLRNKESFSDSDLELMRVWVTDMAFVLENRLVGDGGALAEPIRRRLRQE